MLSKMPIFDKKFAPKLHFFNAWKIEKYSYDFWHSKLTLKFESQIMALFDTSVTPILKIESFPFSMLIQKKEYWDLQKCRKS